MRTALFLLAGFLALAASVVLGRLFAPVFPAALRWSAGVFLAAWLALTVFNLWVGVTHAGYRVAEELPLLALLFGVPAVLAVLIARRWS